MQHYQTHKLTMHSVSFSFSFLIFNYFSPNPEGQKKKESTRIQTLNSPLFQFHRSGYKEEEIKPFKYLALLLLLFP